MERLFTLDPIKEFIVLSASRMTDMPKFYPAELIEEVEKRRKKGVPVHTLVLWTKHPDSLLASPLLPYLEELKKEDIQLYIQLTISGMGKRIVGRKSDGKPLILEPGAPETHASLSQLGNVIELVGKPERIRLRIDPVVRIRDGVGETFTSIVFFRDIVAKASGLGIKTISFSFLEKNMHAKVDRQMQNAGCEIIPPDSIERERTGLWMKNLSDRYAVEISSCSVPNMPVSKCIDGELLSRLHDKGYPAPIKQPKKRALCGCTDSVDLGGWPPKKCYTGCLYCYANALIK